MNHTISGRDCQNLWFNGTLVGETGINAALCGTWGCPVLLVTGDEASCREGDDAPRRRPDDGRRQARLQLVGARNLPPVRARELIEDGAKQALADLEGGAALRPGQPVRDQGRVQEHERRADRLRFQPGVERLDGRTIVSRADTWWEAWKQFYFET